MVSLRRNDGETVLVEWGAERVLRDALVKATKDAGHELSFDEATKIPEMFYPNQYAFYFKSFGCVARQVWNDICADNEDARERKEMMNVGRRKSDREVISAVKAFYDKYKRLPIQTEAVNSDELPSWGRIVKALGPKNTWRAKLGIVEQERKEPEVAMEVQTEAVATVETETEAEVEAEVLPEVVESEVEDLETRESEAEEPEVEAEKEAEVRLETETTVVEEKPKVEVKKRREKVAPAKTVETEVKPVGTEMKVAETETMVLELKISLPKGREKPIPVTINVEI